MGPNWKVPCDEFVGFAHTMVRWPSAEDVSKGSENWKCARLSTLPLIDIIHHWFGSPNYVLGVL